MSPPSSPSGSSDVEGVLDRLIGQFASPYDFLRELVQNSMDAGSDFVEIVLDVHHGHDDEVVFELRVVDAGKGMDEAVIDGELTRLFASSKTDDRTMAGGFGIGFVSVFAWRPDVVLVQTGRTGEAWELVFHRDRRFEKHRVDEPFEGTTIALFRRGRVDERSAMVEAIRDSLWRWCRYCPVEVTFEDVAGGEGLELVRDAPLPEDAAVQHEFRNGPTHIRMAFAVPARSVLLRHGLVLAEGATREVLAELATSLGDSLEHLRVWADSPQLRPNLARDRIVDDEGRATIARQVAAEVAAAREVLLGKVEETAARDEPWTTDEQARLSHLHAHLGYERAHFGRRLLGRPILRRASGRAVSVQTLRETSRANVVAIVEPERVDATPERELVVGALRAGIPVLVGTWPADQGWLDPLLGQVGLTGRSLLETTSRVEPMKDLDVALADGVMRLSSAAGLPVREVAWGTLLDARTHALVGVTPATAEPLESTPNGVIALLGGGLPVSYAHDATLWLDPGHPLVARARAARRGDLRLAVLALTLAVLEHLGPSEGLPGPSEVADALERFDDRREVAG